MRVLNTSQVRRVRDPGRMMILDKLSRVMFLLTLFCVAT
eukprot:CAMPEP_0170587616 /NCGR_PEP_ID=MMETSP0224-20130122/10378_1 /TAXON_ID=285029 /ORGANISM="Togula jolla, Strain CCCM 725" /LENGTH=38 /DNA_ID= /DNA_START= /DNA_END= /DNA_ORIENTATION=